VGATLILTRHPEALARPSRASLEGRTTWQLHGRAASFEALASLGHLRMTVWEARNPSACFFLVAHRPGGRSTWMKLGQPLTLRSAAEQRVSKGGPRAPWGLMVRDASLRDAPHHEDRQMTDSPRHTLPHPEERCGAARLEGCSRSPQRTRGACVEAFPDFVGESRTLRRSPSAELDRAGKTRLRASATFRGTMP
jgi:hypothetical protein